MKIWHPFTQEKITPQPIKIVRGSGAHLFDSRGNKYVDMVSSWWVNILGHANQEIADAIHEQAITLEHVIFAGFTHEPAEKLCKALYEFLPKSLEYFFFSDNGSTAVEVALKMSYQYFRNIGDNERNIYVNLEGGYHGDTIGAMSAAGNASQYHSTFSEFFFKTFSIDFPEDDEREELAVHKLQKFLENYGSKVCALIVEPLVQGAAGMRMYSSKFLEKIVIDVRKQGILVIFDEVMTGFYRTGTMFAMDQCIEKPDIVCLSKAITGGFLPLALTVTNSAVYEAFLSDDWKKAFIHGHSYTANPLGCAAACKALQILQRADVRSNIETIAKTHCAHIRQVCSASNKRSIGTIAAFDVKSAEMARKIKNYLMENGIITRPIGRSVYLLPPYCISSEDLQRAYQSIHDFSCLGR
ncbi:MAG: adenosylmethionine--8-amino-7-oxononanoate transaminase [Holosporales bacterium]|jgi:adenosylmethionine-8-amino-7-oxononanoate aminotransferase|nr:adenosylmethionine--8-amino-7-oxononanoate transaminase [Holosporales bacterium]